MRRAALAALFAAGALAAEDDALRSLRPGHPRLFLDAERLGEVRTLAAHDPLAARVLAEIRRDARSILKQPVSVHEKRDGRRLLDVSRRVLDRVTTLAFVRLVDGDTNLLPRAWAELEAVCAFPDWNPAHFLDTAEMTRAVATGYDWLYGDWTPDQRATLEQAILRLGLQPALLEIERKRFWVTCDHNWNQVCHGGIGLGALAVADRYPAEAAAVLASVRARLPIAMRAYEPDGGGLEGPTYWTYGASYNVALLAGLESALGTDFGLDGLAALGRSGWYQLYLSGPDGRAFNFSDCGDHEVSDPAHFWLARRHGEPAFAWVRRQRLEADPRAGSVYDLLWYDGRGADFDPAALPLDRHFRHAECATMRSAWDDPRALVLAIQGGNTAFNHSHLDRGSFILEALGVRWIVDSGVEPQTYQAHQHHLSRWLFYRLRGEGHNTLVANPALATNGPDQHVKGRAPIVKFESRPAAARAVLDLTTALAPHVRAAGRSFELAEGRRAVVVTDAVRADQPVDLWWFAHTAAKVTVAADGRTAVLEQDGQALDVALDEPKDARLGVMDARPLPSSPDPGIQSPNPDRRKLFLHLPATERADLRVRFTPRWPSPAP